MKLHEYQAKELFRHAGIPVPEGFVAQNADAARAEFAKRGYSSAMVKAQVLAGGRGKAGGIRKASSADEAAKHTAALVGSSLKTYQSGPNAEIIRSVLVESRCNLQKELYLAITIDRSKGLPVLIFSEAGGMDIEEVAAKTPDKVARVHFAPKELGPDTFLNLPLSPELASYRANLAGFAYQLARLFVEKDCQMAEVNPLAVTDKGLLALDAKIIIDDNAMFRHPELEPLRDPQEDDEKEKKAKKFGLSFISLEGNIGCLVNGAGLAMATMDSVKDAGGEPANFLDVGGGATKEAVLEAFRIILQDAGIRAVFVNIFGGIMKCDIIAQALVDAASEIDIRVPVVVRLEGTNVEQGREILKKAKVKLHPAAAMDEAARLAVKLAKTGVPLNA